MTQQLMLARESKDQLVTQTPIEKMKSISPDFSRSWMRLIIQHREGLVYSRLQCVSFLLITALCLISYSPAAGKNLWKHIPNSLGISQLPQNGIRRDGHTQDAEAGISPGYYLLLMERKALPE